MAYIPKNAEWYVADIVERIRVQGDRRSVVHVNTCLIHAKNPDQAYDKAVKLGRSGEITYLNPRGKKVEFVFLGLRDLNVLHDPLEDGAELLYTEHVGMSDAASGKLARPRSSLSVFRPIRRPRGRPDFSNASILADAARRITQRKQRRDA